MTAAEARIEMEIALEQMALPNKVLDLIKQAAKQGKNQVYIIADELSEAPKDSLWATELSSQTAYMLKLGKKLTNSPYGYRVVQDKNALTISW